LATLDATRVAECLRRLATAKTDIFGANGHHFLLNSPLAESDVLAFEQRHNIRLPAGYRHFLIAIGNGGAGPYHGLFPLGMMDDMGNKLKQWREDDGFVGLLSEPFSLTDEWNDVQGMPSDELFETDERTYEKQLDQFDKRYFDSALVNGAIPICHEGCALRIWLVLTGEQAGRIWRDGRADHAGLKPVQLADGSAATFSLWYGEWLEDALQQAGLIDLQQHSMLESGDFGVP
jgi:hypothetical protein